MDKDLIDMNAVLMVDGNAVAGLLQEIFAAEMTMAPTCCASCGREGEMGSLQVYQLGPGVILRCPACQQIVLRIVRTPRMTYMDARGAMFWGIPA